MNKRTVGAMVFRIPSAPAEIVPIQQKTLRATLSATAARKGRVVVESSVVFSEQTMDGLVIMRASAMTAPKPDWKRKAVTQ